MLIRPAQADRDADACASIYAPSVTGGATSFEQEPPDGEEMGRRIARISERYPWLVAESEGTVIGYAYASPHSERAAYRWSVDAAVYIGEGHRGRGVGRALYQALFERLAGQGLRTVCAGITLPNQASVALHESCGFQAIGVYRKIGFKAGQWRDVGWWQLDLAPGSDGPPSEPGPPSRH